MRETGSPPSCCFRSSCAFGASLNDLQQLWNEIGENEADKDGMILELEMQCLQLYRRKVEEAANVKARLHQSVAAKEAELATLMASLAEPNDRSWVNSEKRSISLKEKLASVTPLVEDLRRKREERMRQFTDTRLQIEKISREILGYGYSNSEEANAIRLDEADLSLRKLAEYETRLRTLQREKSDRLQKVLGHVSEVHSLCCVLGIDFCETVSEVHPSLQGRGVEQTTNISDCTLEGLEQTISKLKGERKSRIHKVKDIVSSLLELWNLMDSSNEERNKFSRIASVLGSSECDISEPGILSTEMIDQASAEVERLNKLKASRMKELVLKKRLELEAICRMAHFAPDTSTATEKSNVLIDSGMVDPSELLVNIEEQIVKAKDETMSRRDIMERIDRWLAACEEESWLEEYNQDDNRYHSGRGAHINLKRAERARVTVTKIPAMIDNLINRTLTWEDEKGKFFLYDGERLVSILDDYKISRKRKQEEKRRQRDQKKLQDMRLTEKEAVHGSRPSPRKSPSFRKSNGYSVNGNGSIISSPRRSSVGSASSELLTPRSHSGRENGFHEEMRRLSTARSNFAAISKEDAISTYTSICGSEPSSPPHADMARLTVANVGIHFGGSLVNSDQVVKQ